MHLSTSFLTLASAASLIAPTFALAPPAYVPAGLTGVYALPEPLQATYRPIAVSNAPKPAPALEKRFEYGWCTLHFTQYKMKWNGRTAVSTFDIRILDDFQRIVGGFNGLEIPYDKGAALRTDMKLPLHIRPGERDWDPVTFFYKETWTTSDDQCKV
ncbi:MAG: hypothetical protein Q9214_005607, partial [Letrouitia sp. 1 TL-2023]